MNPPNSPPTVAEALGRILDSLPRKDRAGSRSGLGAHRVRSVRGLVTATKKGLRRFLLAEGTAPVAVRVAEHVDLELDALVHDGVLGSLGLVWSVPAEIPDRGWVRQRIDGAAYLRHLLLEQARPGPSQAARLPHAVEVVFAVRAANPGAAQSACTRIGEVLREITRDESYLDAVGINLWTLPPGGGSGEPDEGFRRAFSWLLTAAGAWYARSDQPRAEGGKQAGTGGGGSAQAGNGGVQGVLRAFEVEDFRVQGTRRLELDPKSSLHLVFGHNGSGKSSLCEALELVVTGRIQRLERNHRTDPPDYLRTLTNRTAREQSRSAEVSLERADAGRRSWTVEPTGVSSPLGSGLTAASFRLDQFVADELAQGDDARRARLFLEAFFPAERKELEELGAREVTARATFDKLPEAVRARLGSDPRVFDAKQAAKVLEPLAAEAVPWPEVLAWLPVPLEWLTALGSQLPASVVEMLRKTGPATASEIDGFLPSLDRALSEVAGQVEIRMQALGQVIRLLEEYGGAAVSPTAAESEPLVALVNRWLEHVAWADLLEREDQILSTLETARQAGFAGATGLAPSIGGPAGRTPEERRKTLEQVQRERDGWRQRVTGFRTAAERIAQEAKTLRPLADFHPESLDQAAHWGVFGEACRTAVPALGSAVRRAFRERKPVEVQASGGTTLVSVGTPGWGLTLLADAQRALQALQQLGSVQTKLTDSAAALAVVWPTLKQLREGAIQVNALNREVLDKFLELVRADQPLGRAINEVMALLTPARWAYQDISPRLDVKGGAVTLEVLTPDRVHADLRLNTAELNTFALAIFLLCAPTAPNPLRLLVLDDPLQNMDELTVTTVARGVGRLVRLWRSRPGGEAWRLLMLMHDENGLDRFRNETPCAGYILPWLSPQDGVPPGTNPAGAGAPPALPAVREEPEDVARLRRIKPVASLLLFELQSLDPILGARPPTRSA